jgi:hypothetical protein
MSWGKNIEQMKAPDLHPITPRITAYGREARRYYPHERRIAKADPHRRLLLSTIFQAAADYHKAKRICKDKKVKSLEDFKALPKESRQFVSWGWKAHEWFTQGPSGESPDKITFAQVCEQFGADPKKLWRKIKSTPDIVIQLGEMRSGCAG